MATKDVVVVATFLYGLLHIENSSAARQKKESTCHAADQSIEKMPTIVHGVDVSALEGWMIKINSNPSVFGKNTSRRWFCVSYVPAGNDKKLIISYSTSKTSKEPRGWLYIEDVSGVYCRRDMIEIVSPARTLRFKGETTVEHRLWSDSLHRLCNPPKPTSVRSIEEEKRLDAERIQQEKRHQEKLRAQDRDRIADPKKTREHVDSFRERKPMSDRADSPPTRREPTPESGRQSRMERKRRDSESEDSGSSDRGQNNDSSDEESDRAPRRRQSMEPAVAAREHSPRRRSAMEVCREPAAAVDGDRRGSISRSPRRKDSDEDEDEHEDSDEENDDADIGVEQAKQLASTERRPSLLVASIKSLSPVVTTPAEPKATAPTKVPAQSSRSAKAVDSDDDDGDGDDARPQHTTPRDEPPVEHAAPVLEQVDPSRDASPGPVHKAKNTDYFDDSDGEDEEDTRTNNKRRPSVPEPVAAVKAPTSSEIRPDNNFADDDWDADDTPAPPVTKPRSPEKRVIGMTGGVTADTNFASEDWD